MAKYATPEKDSQTCLACHKMGTNSLKPHSIDPRLLAAKSPAQNPKADAPILSLASRVKNILPDINGRTDNVFCASCHKEHRDGKAGLNMVDSAGCHTCHQTKFDDFSKNHPEFKNYPFARRLRIKFNHTSHFSKHFPDTLKKRPDDTRTPQACANCHTPTTDQKHMAVAPFEKSCASCHLQQIKGTDRATGAQGIALLSLPGIDLQALEENNLSIGQWPAESEAELSPLMKLLLGGTQRGRNLLAAVADLDLQDLSGATPDKLQAVVELTREVKRLLSALSTSKASNVLKHVQSDVKRGGHQQLIAKLLATLPRDVLIAAQQSWLPKLNAEVASFGEPGWAASVRKRTVAPAPKPAKVETVAQPKPEPENTKVAKAGPAERLSTNPQFGSWRINELGELVQQGDPSGKIPPDSDQQPNAAEKPEQSSPATPPAESNEPKETSTASDEPLTKAKTAVDAETWAEFGGWYRKDYSILYKPTGHKDAFMRAWLDYSGQGRTPSKKKLNNQVFDLLADRTAQGQCIKCHSIDAGRDGDKIVQWQPSSSANKSQRFTRFTHEPHFRLLNDRGCLSCHEMNDAKKFEKAYSSLNPSRFVPNFKQVDRKLCASCHKAGAARQDCALCHMYHVNPITSPIMSTKLPKQ
ncbi:MAG: hypothetical protein JXQ99_17535 [Hyphomicrobiaceae bacterium]